MRLLHTADWHVGRALARRQRLDEARAVLGEMVEIVRERDVDVVLVCGDVFEHLAPSAEAESIVFDTLLQLECLDVPAVVIPGNHDHPGRWEALEPILARLGTRIVPRVRRPDGGGIVEVRSAAGEELQVAALPWVSERRLVGAAEMMDLAEVPHQAYADRMAALLEGLCEPLDPRKCQVLAAHLFVSGASPGGGERSLTIGQLYAVTPRALPAVQYVALGHVHRPQEIAGAAGPARYAGSLLQLDFGEAGHDKSVTLVDLEPGVPARAREVPLTAGRRLLDLRGRLGELEERVDEVGDSWLRVTLECGGPEPGLGDRVRDIFRRDDGSEPVVEVRLDYPRERETDDAPSMGSLTPREQLARYLERVHGGEPDSRTLDLFEELLQEVSS